MRAAALLALLLIIPILQASPDVPVAFERGAMPDAVLAAAERVPHKVPAGFSSGPAFVRDDGTMQVILNLDGDRDGWATWFQARGIPYAPFFSSEDAIAHVTPGQLIELLEHPRVIHVEPDRPLSLHLATSTLAAGVRSASPYDPRGAWRLGDEGLEAAYGLDRLYAGEGVTVAVIDSGIDGTHGDFGDWDCDAITKSGCDTRILERIKVGHLSPIPLGLPEEVLPTTEFASGHGTHVAGTVLGNGRMSRDTPAPGGGDGINLGVAPYAQMVSLSVGDGLSAGLASYGLDWVVANHQEYGIKVTSNSYGCGSGCAYDPNSARSAVQQALYEAGIVSVFTAGNNAGTGDGASFGGYSQNPYVISVAAYDDEINEVSGFSSRGSIHAALHDPVTWDPVDEAANGAQRRPDIVAPGDFVYAPRTLTGGAASLSPRVDAAAGVPLAADFAGPYAFMSGTSMAAPHVSGAAAVLFDACPDARPLDIMRAIYATAKPTVEKTSVPRDPALYPDQNDWSYGDGPAEPFEVGYGALGLRSALDWLLLRGCDSDTVPDVAAGDEVVVAPRVAVDWLAPASGTVAAYVGSDAVAIQRIDGGPAGLAWDGQSQQFTGMAWHPGDYTVIATLESGHRRPLTLTVAEGDAPVLADGEAITGMDLPLDEPIYGWFWVPYTLTASSLLEVCDPTICPGSAGAGIAVSYLAEGAVGDTYNYAYRYQAYPALPDADTPELRPGWWTITLDGGEVLGEGRFAVTTGAGAYLAPTRWSDAGVQYVPAGTPIELTWPTTPFEVLEEPEGAVATDNGTAFVARPGANVLRLQVGGEQGLQEVAVIMAAAEVVEVEAETPDDVPVAAPETADTPDASPVDGPEPEPVLHQEPAEQESPAPFMAPLLLLAALLRRRPDA